MLMVRMVEDYFDIHYNIQAIAPATEVIIKRLIKSRQRAKYFNAQSARWSKTMATMFSRNNGNNGNIWGSPHNL